MRIEYSVDTIYGTFKDCLTYTDEEFSALTEEDIETEKGRRLANWADAIVNQPPMPSEEDIRAWALANGVTI